MRKTVALTVFLLLVLAFAFPALAATNHKAVFVVGQGSYTVDGQPREMDAAPFVENGRTFVPVRYLAYALGVEKDDVVWVGETGTVSLQLGGKLVQMTVGNRTLYVNGQPREMDVAPLVKEGRTYLPAKFVAETFDYEVGWDDGLQAVLTGPPGQLPEAPATIKTESTLETVNNKDSFVFDVLGDSKILPGKENWRGNKVLAEAVEKINQDNPALVIYLGDGVDQGGPAENLLAFREYLAKLRSPWYPVIGNHELNRGAEPSGRAGNGESNFRQIFADKLPVQGRSYYSFNYKNSHFIVLDTAWQNGGGPKEAELKPGSQQWEWLRQDLAGARSRSQHIFIFGHKPPVSPFRSGGPDTVSNLPDGYGTSWGDPGTAVEFMRMAANYHVDAVFSGHIHMYNRLDMQGVPYFITAGAGASLYASPESGGYYHYLRCRVKGEQVSYEVVKLSVPE